MLQGRCGFGSDYLRKMLPLVSPSGPWLRWPAQGSNGDPYARYIRGDDGGKAQRMSEVVLDAKGLCKRFGATVALEGAGITLRAGEIHALMGQNGAGKSTLIKL